MHMKNRRFNQGFIGTIVIILVAIVLLKFWFHFDIFTWFQKPEVKEFFGKIWSVITMIWNKYLKETFQQLLKFINEVIIKHF